MSAISKVLLLRRANHETGTNFTADKAIDGDDNTRWATDRDVPKPTFELTLPKLPLSSM